MDLSELRSRAIAGLARRMDDRHHGLGRTALMKLAYFLQDLKGVPLGYDFRLYTYGPYDAQVLEDLKVAEHLGLLVSETFEFSNGIGYRIRPSARVAEDAEYDVPAAHRGILDAAVEEFGSKSAIDLEMASTILFVARAEAADAPTIDRIARKVHELKPRLDPQRIRSEARRMLEKDYIRAAA